MNQELNNTISRIYINHEDNHATNEEIVTKMKADLEDMLSKIKILSFSISLSHDPEYKRIEYGENCAVALDIFVNVPNNEHTLVFQISKLGKFACYYWRVVNKNIWSYYSKVPEGWPSDIFSEVYQAILKCGFRIFEDKELGEIFEGVVKYITENDEEIPETIGGLLFCYDGPH
jgi:hypothetical protein